MRALVISSMYLARDLELQHSPSNAYVADSAALDLERCHLCVKNIVKTSVLTLGSRIPSAREVYVRNTAK